LMYSVNTTKTVDITEFHRTSPRWVNGVAGQGA
jgi:hypothetical protein